jgi:hypothetical protein
MNSVAFPLPGDDEAAGALLPIPRLPPPLFFPSNHTAPTVSLASITKLFAIEDRNHENFTQICGA